MEEKYKSKQTTVATRKPGRLRDSVLKASGTAITIAIKNQGPETGRNLPWDTQQAQIVGIGVLLSEQDRVRRRRHKDAGVAVGIGFGPDPGPMLYRWLPCLCLNPQVLLTHFKNGEIEIQRSGGHL